MKEKEIRTTYILLYDGNFKCEKCWFEIYTDTIANWNYCPGCGGEIDSIQTERSLNSNK